MGRASISIAITSNFNPSGIDAAIAKMEKLAVQSTSLHGKFGKNLVDSGAQLGVAASYLEKWGKAVADLGDRMTMGITVPMGIAAGAAIKCATDIDTAWYNVRKTVDMTEEGYQRLKDGAMALSETQPVSAETILNIESLGGQLGITTGYLEDFAKVVSGLDIASNLTADEAATSLAQFRNITQMAEEDLDNFASTVVDLGNHTATTEADMLQLALRFASAGHVAGMSNADILGLSAALAGLGMKAEAGGSALSRSINDISLSVAKGGEDLQKWADLVGKTPEQFAEAWRNAPTDEFIEVLQAIGRDGADANEILNDLGITQIRQSDAMRRLASSGDLVTESVKRANQAWQENTALDREVSNRNESLAAQFETIKNRLTNTAANFGEPIAKMCLQALDALDPLISGVSDAANAFADADPFVQRFAFNLGLVAAAAGPVLSITGRLMQGAGSLGKNIGRAMQQYGVFTEALKTNDVALIRNYSEMDTLATNLGLSRNAAVRAAGGIDQFKLRAAAATEVIKDEAESAEMGRIFTEAYTGALAVEGTTNAKAMNIGKRAVATRKSQNQITQAGQRALEGLSAAEMEAVLATDKGQQALARQTQAAKTSASTLTSLKGVLLGLGGIAAMTAIGAGITWVATQLSEVERRTNLYRDATKGLSEAVGDATVHLGAEAEGFRSVEERTVNVAARADACYESQAKLAESIRETGHQAEVQIGSLNHAKDVIQQYANQSGLNASEQYQLKHAIDTVNEACDTQFSVVDASNGKIADETGTIQENTDAILENIEARKKEIQLESYQKQWDDMYEQHLKNEEDLGTIYAENKDVIDKGNAALKRRAEIMDELDHTEVGSSRWTELTNELTTLTDAFDPIFENYRGIEIADDELLEGMGVIEKRERDITGETEEMTGAIASWLQEAGKQSLFEKLNKDMGEFSAACEAVGLGVEDLEGMSRPVLDNLVSNFDGSVESIIKSLSRTDEGRQYLDRLGVSLDDLLVKLSDPALGGKFTDAFSGPATASLEEFSAACQRAGLNFDALNSLTSEDLSAIAANFDGTAYSIVQSLESIGRTDILDNLGSNWVNSLDDLSTQLVSGIQSAHDVSLAELASLANDLGIEGEAAMHRFLEGIQNGMDAGLNVEQAAMLADAIVNDFETALNPEQAADLTRRFIDNIARGMGDKGALEQAIQSLKDSLSQVNFTDEGRNAKDTWLAGFNSGGGNGDPVGGLRSQVDQGLNALGVTVNERGELTGEQVPLKFAEGVDANAGAVTGSADAMIQNIIGSLMGGVGQATDAGSQTGQGYGNAVSGQGSVAETAAVNTLGRLLAIWLAGIMSARQAGLRTGQAYGEGAQAGFTGASNAALTAVYNTVAYLATGIGPAQSAGQQTGAGYGLALSTNLLNAAVFAQAAVATITAALNSGVSPAQNAGQSTGSAYAVSLAKAATVAVNSAASIGRATGSAFGSGAGAASSAGSALGSAFANAVRSSASAAIGYARSVKASVASIFASIPTANIRVNVKTVGGGGYGGGGGGGAIAALPSSVPVMPVPFSASASRAAVVAERAVQRVSTTTTRTSPSSNPAVAVTALTGSQTAPIDYDAMYRVVRGGVKAAIRESGGLAPTVELDGRVVSRQLAPQMDYELGRLQGARR